MSTLTRPFAATRFAPLPTGEGGAQRRVKCVLTATTLLLFLATSASTQYVPPVLKGVQGEGAGRRALKPIPFPAADEKWILARSKHFVFISSAGEKRTHDIAAGLETLAAALTQMSPRFSSPKAETRVFLFSRHREAQPYFDLLIGRENAHVTGIFVSQNNRGSMLMETGFGFGSDRTPFHELVHYLMDNGGRRPPLWIEEGIAEYFSNAQMRKAAVYAGEPVQIHLQALKKRALISLPQLFSVERESNLYNVPDFQRSFYAQSWALVDWLMRQNQAAFDDFLRDLEEGKPVEQALRARYHKSIDDLTQAFDVSFGRPSFGVTLPVANADTNVAVVPLDRAELLYQLGKFLSSIEEGGPNAERHFREALIINPAHARALAGLGDYEKAIAADPNDAGIYLDYAESLLGKEIGLLAEADPPSAEEATKFRKVRQLAQRAVDLGTDPGRAYGDLGTTYMIEKDADLGAGIGALEKSRALLPGRLDYAVHLFAMYRRVRDRAKANPLFVELDRARNPQVAYAMRATIMRVELAHANALVHQQKLDEAAAVIRDLADNTSDSDAKQDLIHQAEEITRAAATNREIEIYNRAIGQINRGEYSKALKTLDQLLLTATDAGVIRDAKKLQKQLNARRKA
jgi:tetratricopeptide (TPR) repeat protein